MKLKRIEAIFTPPASHMVGDGFKVHQFIPSVKGLDMKRMDPFLLLDYNAKQHVEASSKPKGVGVHPHRGFETVTLAYKGRIAHHDSAGNAGIIGEGDVQWMTAASGVLHKEYYEEEWAREGGDFQMVQLWVNLPRKYKEEKPRYQALASNDFERVYLSGNNSYIEIIAGEYAGKKGKAMTFSPIHLMNARLTQGDKAEFSFPKDYTTFLLVIEGNIYINESIDVKADHLLLFAYEGETFSITASKNSVVLIVSGEPLKESIAAYGPFVMNTQKELIQAFEDFNKGKYGILND